jgi:hypothetical protein
MLSRSLLGFWLVLISGTAMSVTLTGCAETQPVAAEAEEIEDAVNQANDQAAAIRSERTRSQRN